MNKIIGIFIFGLFAINIVLPATGFFMYDGPYIEITWPSNNYVTSDSSIVITGFASGELPLNEYGYTIEYPGGGIFSEFWPINPSSEYYEFEIPINLVEGEDGNLITVYAKDTQNEKGFDSVVVIYIPGEEDNEGPVIVITYPKNNDIFTDPDILLKGSITDNVGIVHVSFYQKWNEGEIEIFIDGFTDPKPLYQFSLDIELKEGNNTLIVNAMDASNNSNQTIVTVRYQVEVEEGLYIDCLFQPVQVLYPDDPRYGNDVTGGPCNWDTGLDMIAGKNTYIFGYPYSDRNKIDITVCNNYDEDKTFQFVLKIYSGDPLPEEKEIWRSGSETVPRKSDKTFSYDTPIPEDGPFQWDWWGLYPTVNKTGSIELSIDPDYTGGIAGCDCSKVTHNINLKSTHDLDVLFIPFTFGDGPEFPGDLDWPTGDFWRWMREDLEPWWKSIYPIREDGINLGMCYWYQKRNFTIDGITVSDYATFDSLNKNQKQQIFLQLVSGSYPLQWLHECSNAGCTLDRIVWLIYPDIISSYNNFYDGFMFTFYKLGGFVKWNLRNPISAHEITHTYGIHDSYILTNGTLTYRGDPGIGYWVNEDKDIPTSWDLMSALGRAWNIKEWVWIKKPNYKILITKFNRAVPDPKVLGVSGVVHKNNSVILYPWYQLDPGTIDLDWGENGEYLIKAFDDNNNLLYQTGFNTDYTQINDFIEDEILSTSIFSFRLPYFDEITKISIYNASSNSLLASRTKSSNIPTVEITSPSDGGRIKADKFIVEWNADDFDGDSLTFNLLASNDSGNNWLPIAFDEIGNSCNVNFSNTGKGDYMIRIYVTDGWNVAEDTIGFHVKNTRNIDFIFLRIFEKYPIFFRILQKYFNT